MKRKISILLLLLCCVYFLFGFGILKSYHVERAIKNIGFVTIESREDIEAAEKLYAELSEKDRNRVDNYEVLVAARAELERLVGLVETAQNAIDALPEPITRDSGPAIIAANQAYNAARAAVVHDRITGYDKIDAAIQTYAALVMEDAGRLMQQHRYVDAYQLYVIVWDNFPNCAYGGEAYYGCRDAGTGNAEALYNSGRTKEALDTLNAVEDYFGTSETGQTLREKIYQRLEQQRPRSGQIFQNNIGWGYCEFSVSAGSRDACIKLENVNDPSKYALFYVRAGEEAMIKVKDGNYIAKYATGEYWFNKEALFGESTSYTQAEDILEFTSTRDGSSIYYSTIQITLYEVVGGDLETSQIDPGSF